METDSLGDRRPRAVLALLLVLSVIAGCTDVIGFLGLNGGLPQKWGVRCARKLARSSRWKPGPGKG